MTGRHATEQLIAITQSDNWCLITANEYLICLANNSGVNKRQITDLVDQSIQINSHCFVVTADNRYILVCGFWDKSFRVYSSETGTLAD